MQGGITHLAPGWDPAASLRPVMQRAEQVAPVVLVVLCITAAYHYSLQTLIAEMGQDSPLAYLGLVPVIALLLAAVLAPHPGQLEGPRHDRVARYVVGLPLLGVALALVVMGPDRLSSFYWLRRLDLISLPLFVAGAIALVFGVRALWRLRAAVAFLVLAWPYPYILFLDHQLAWFTATTASAVRGMLGIIPVASVLPDGDFLVHHVGTAGKTFVLTVSSTCSGVNSGLGFLIAGGAATIVMRGRLHWKLIWLACGTALLFFINIDRLFLILAAGRAWGEGIAVNVLHPVIGLVMILAVTAAMLALLPRFHLTLGLPQAAPRGPAASPPRRRPWQVGTRVPLILLGGATVAAALSNGSMSRFELLTFGLGSPRIASSTLMSATQQGWSLAPSADYPAVAHRFFGADGTWNRYAYVETANPNNTAPPAAVTMDVVGTDDLDTFSTYGVEACYRFHSYDLLEARAVDLRGGLTGRLVRYHTPNSRTNWLAVYWEWPVHFPGKEYFQRIVLIVDTSASANELDERSLVSLARTMVGRAAYLAPTGATTDW